MTTSRTAFLSEILHDDVIPPGKLAYFRRRLSNHLYALVVNEFLRLEKEGLITKAKLARRIGRGPEQLSRWFGSSGNWTIETLSDLLIGMKAEPVVSISSLATQDINESHAAGMPKKQPIEEVRGNIVLSYGTGGAPKTRMSLDDDLPVWQSSDKSQLDSLNA